MTIKEAFQQLANATKKGMKNPFFIMRSLNKNFSEIADGIEGGGSDIEYSTEEKKIGKWIDGKPVYQKTFITDTTINVPKTTWYTIIDSGIPIEYIISYSLIGGQGSTYDGKFIRCSDTDIQLYSETVFTLNDGFKLTLQYTKSST